MTTPLERLRSRAPNDLSMENLLGDAEVQEMVHEMYQDPVMPNPEVMDPVPDEMLHDPTPVAIAKEAISTASALQGPIQASETLGGAMSSPGVVSVKLPKKKMKKMIKKAIKEIYGDPQDKSLPMGDVDHLERAITALSPSGYRGRKVKFKKGTRAGALRRAASQINKLGMSEDKREHLRDRLSAVKEYKTPRPLNWRERRQWKRKEYKPGVTIIKGSDDLRLAFIVTSNSYQDREGEWVTTKALQNYVDSCWSEDDEICKTKNVYLFWHSADAIGDIIWADMQGPFLIEVAKERPDRIVNIAREDEPTRLASIRKVWDYIEQNPDNIEWGASQGFKASKKEVMLKTFRDVFKKFETSTLPLEKAANSITFTGVMTMPKREDVLDRITGTKQSSKQVKSLRKGVGSIQETLERLGIRHKSMPDDEADVDKGIVEDLTETVEDFLSELIDGDDKVIKEVAPEVVEAIMQTLAGERNKKKKESAGSYDGSYENRGAGEADDDQGEEDGDDATPATQGYRKKGYKYADPKATLHPMAKDMDEEDDLMTVLVKSQKDLSQAMIEMSGDVKKLKKLKELPEVLVNLVSRLENVEKQLSARPRAVSRDLDGGSVLKNVDEGIIAAIEKQMQAKDDFFGVHVRPS